MSSSTSYNKVNPIDQAYHEARRKTRIRLTIISISFIVLIAIIVISTLAARNSSSEPDNPNPNNSFSTSMKALCDLTLYPRTCMASIPPSLNSTEFDPAQIFNTSLLVAVKGFSDVSKKLQELTFESKSKSKLALENCKELVDMAIDHLNECTESFTMVDDVKTWLSSVITNQDTCIEGFEKSTENSTKVDFSNMMKNSTEFASNSLAIFTNVNNFLSSFKSRRRLLTSSTTPSWLSKKDRKLLQNSNDMRKSANFIVAKDGSGKYKSIKDALEAVPEKSKKRSVIYVKAGVYYENVRVEKNMWNVMIVGDGKYRTIVSGELNVVDGTPTFSTATFAAFGKGFMAREIGFRNTAGSAKHQAVALMSNSDQSIFYRCSFDGYQDTLYTHANRQFYKECDIYGTVDFIFGNAAVVLQNCNILPRVPLKGQQDTITAQGKMDPNQNTGISIHECDVRPFGNLSLVNVFLGRPWKNYSTTVFMKSRLDGFIHPNGWMPWVGDSAPDTIFYSEYENFGAGAVSKSRVKWKGVRKMSKKEASGFTVGEFIGGGKWIGKVDVPYKSGI